MFCAPHSGAVPCLGLEKYDKVLGIQKKGQNSPSLKWYLSHWSGVIHIRFPFCAFITEKDGIGFHKQLHRHGLATLGCDSGYLLRFEEINLQPLLVVVWLQSIQRVMCEQMYVCVNISTTRNVAQWQLKWYEDIHPPRTSNLCKPS